MSRQEQIAFALFIMMAIAEGLSSTEEIDDCFRWAIGDDWEELPISQWRSRVEKRVGLRFSPDATYEEVVTQIMREYKRRRGD